MCRNLDCEHCHKLSFASQPAAKQWSKKNKLTPREVFRAVDKKYWFDCQTCGTEFQIALDKVAAGRWCANCGSSHFEKNVADWLDANRIKYQKEYSFKDSKYRYDFYVEERDLLIECDGGQHFWVVPYFHPESENETSEENFKRKQEDDRKKDQLVRDKEMYLIRLDHRLAESPLAIGKILSYFLGIVDHIDRYTGAHLEYRDRVYYSNKKLYEYLLSPVSGEPQTTA